MLAELVLSAALAQWKTEIEAKSGLPVVVAEVEYAAARHEYTLPSETPHVELFARQLGEPAFVREFTQMYAAAVQLKGEAFLVMLNGARKGEWAGHEESLIAHEFGHAWVKAQGYATAQFVPGPAACVAVHAGDIPQHVLIRAEMAARGIDDKAFWKKSLAAAVERMEKGEGAGAEDRCAGVQLAAKLVDARLGLERDERLEGAVRRYRPEVVPVVDEIVEYMRGHDVREKGEMRAALIWVFGRLKPLSEVRARD